MALRDAKGRAGLREGAAYGRLKRLPFNSMSAACRRRQIRYLKIECLAALLRPAGEQY